MYSKKSMILDMHSPTDEGRPRIGGNAPAEGLYIVKSGVVNTVEFISKASPPPLYQWDYWW